MVDLSQGVQLKCRRYPPQVVAMVLGAGVTITGVQPVMQPADVCGEFRPRAPALASA